MSCKRAERAAVSQQEVLLGEHDALADWKEESMYAVVRRYRFDPKNSEEIDRRIKEVFVHLVRRAPGFENYFWLNTGDGEGASLSVFRDRAGAEESTRIAAKFVEQHLATLLGNPDEIIQGEIQAHADRSW